MSETNLRADKRTETARRIRNEGFVPGVMYGTGITGGMPVKFNELELNKVLKSQGMNPRMTITLGEDPQNVLIKEIQRDPVKRNVIHIDLQAIAVDEVIRTTIPIVFEGREEVEGRHLLLEVYLFEIEVSGPANIIPDSITVNVSENEVGETVTMADIKLEEGISALTALDEVLAVVTMPRIEEEDEEDADEDDDIIEDADAATPEEEEE